MQVGQLTVNLRTGAGKGAAHRLRASGLVPGVCYGESTDGRIEPIQIAINVKALKAALDPVRKQNTVIALSIEDGGKTVKSLSALVREYQIDTIRRDITHVDLLAIDPNKEVTAVVPLEFIGKPAGIINGGLTHTVMRSLEVKCKPADIPVKLELDISPLDIGDVLHVSDVKLPAGVKPVTAGREAVISMVAPEKEAAVEAAPEAAAAATPAAAGKDAKAAPAAAGKDAKAAPAGKAAAPAKPAAKK
ncbi:MAG: 50S ribosomal protein L25 [Myxococcales bacterium]|nr:50S ribosomal protein L25 [Myxococcales bacterium]MBK7197928.1 50S ribosomal protein L25 [Myxococcales bacterium]MBP6846107.1 50S ribosomal protein L25 [Kofleriaceae bacterium]